MPSFIVSLAEPEHVAVKRRTYSCVIARVVPLCATATRSHRLCRPTAGLMLCCVSRMSSCGALLLVSPHGSEGLYSDTGGHSVLYHALRRTLRAPCARALTSSSEAPHAQARVPRSRPVAPSREKILRRYYTRSFRHIRHSLFDSPQPASRRPPVHTVVGGDQPWTDAPRSQRAAADCEGTAHKQGCGSNHTLHLAQSAAPPKSHAHEGQQAPCSAAARGQRGGREQESSRAERAKGGNNKRETGPGAAGAQASHNQWQWRAPPRRLARDEHDETGGNACAWGRKSTETCGRDTGTGHPRCHDSS